MAGRPPKGLVLRSAALYPNSMAILPPWSGSRARGAGPAAGAATDYGLFPISQSWAQEASKPGEHPGL